MSLFHNVVTKINPNSICVGNWLFYFVTNSDFDSDLKIASQKLPVTTDLFTLQPVASHSLTADSVHWRPD